MILYTWVMEIVMTKREKREMLPYVLWLNLILGLQNLYFYVNNDSLFNLLVGAVNIGVWVFYRKIAFRLGKK